MPEPENFPNAPYLTVADPRRSIRFYQRLGFALESTWPDAKHPEYASLALERQGIMLGSSLSEKAAKKHGLKKAELRRVKKEHKAFKKHPHGVGVKLYLRVPDVDAHHRVAKRAKLDVRQSPTTHFYGIRDFVVADPDGYALVFFAHAEAEVELEPAPRRKSRKKNRRAAASTEAEQATQSDELPAALEAVPAPV